MTACLKNRKGLALLAIGALEEPAAKRLILHVENCKGCQGYLREISAVVEEIDAHGDTPEVQAPASFHRRVMSALSSEARIPVWRQWRFILPSVSAVAVIVCALLLSNQPPIRPASTPPGSLQVKAVPSLPPNLDPTLFRYQMAVNQSFEKLDALLAAQARRESSRGYLYRASMGADVNIPE